jgi:hypothetical protein
MAIIDRYRKFVFVHNMKAGGTWLIYSLGGQLIKHDHSNVAQVQQWFFENEFLEFWDCFFSFGIVRDPYARFYSLYIHLKNTPSHGHHFLAQNKTLDEFAVDFEAQAFKSIIEDGRYFYDTQLEFFSVAGKLGVARIFSFENLEPMVTELKTRFRVDMLNFRLGGSGQPGSARDQFHATANRQTVLAVGRMYGPDFEAFSYQKLN